MYFQEVCDIKYIMRRLLRLVGACLCVFAVIAGAVVAFSQTDSEKKENKAVALTLWQIDSFEGGKGSRAEYLQSLANNYYEGGVINQTELRF